MTEQELIKKLQALKTITPNREWAFSVKRELLEGKTGIVPVPSFVDTFISNFKFQISNFQPKLAYAFAAFLLVAIGAVGIWGMDSVPVADKSVAVLSPDFVLKTRVEAFKEKSQNLAAAPKTSKSYSVAVKEVQDAAKQLATTIAENPSAAKDIAIDIQENKTFADVLASSDVEQASNELYKAIDEQMITDLEKVALTEAQVKILLEAKELVNQEKYAQALEQILLIDQKSK